jgi:hypothetical protein
MIALFCVALFLSWVLAGAWVAYAVHVVNSTNGGK